MMQGEDRQEVQFWEVSGLVALILSSIHSFTHIETVSAG